jgi:hypothetical protein
MAGTIDSSVEKRRDEREEKKRFADAHGGASPNVGTRLLFENDRVRVWEMRLAPGESSERHMHENDYLFVQTTAAELTLFPDDHEPETSEARAGGVEYREVGQRGIVHRLQNTGDTEYREILVELKAGSRSRLARPPQTNG